MKNLAKYRMVHETPSHFIMHDGKAHFHIAKQGLSQDLSQKIQQLAKGGEVAITGKVEYPEGTSQNVKDNFTPEEAQHNKAAKERFQEQQHGGDKTPAPKKVSPEETYGRNIERASHPQGYSEGGRVTPQDYSDAASLKRLHKQGGRITQQDVDNEKNQYHGYSEGGPVLDPRGVKSLSDAFGGKKEEKKPGDIQHFAGVDGVSAQEVQPEAIDKIPASFTTIPTDINPTGEATVVSAEPTPQLPAAAPAAPAIAPAIQEPSPLIKGPQSLDEAQQMENKGVMQVADAQSKAAADSAKALQSYQTAEIARQQLVSEHMKQLDNQNEQLFKAATSNKIDPNRVWHNMDTGGKITAALGLILGGVGSGMTGGPNMAQHFLDKTIENDLEAQKSDQSNTMNAYKVGLERYRDAQSASSFAALQAGTLVASKLQQIAASSNNPAIQGRAQQQIAEIYTKMAPLKMELAQRSLALDLANGGSGQGSVEGLSPEYRERAVTLPDGKTRLAKTKEGAAALSKNLPVYTEVEHLLNTMESQMDDDGRAILPYGKVKAAAESTRQQILAKMSQLEGLNRLTEKELEIFEKILPSGGDFFQDAAREKLKSALESVQMKRRLDLKSHLAGPLTSNSNIQVAPPVFNNQAPVSNKQMKKMGR